MPAAACVEWSNYDLEPLRGGMFMPSIHTNFVLSRLRKLTLKLT
jgi:hypothetical protein